jgi:hypothetical protein
MYVPGGITPAATVEMRWPTANAPVVATGLVTTAEPLVVLPVPAAEPVSVTSSVDRSFTYRQIPPT